MLNTEVPRRIVRELGRVSGGRNFDSTFFWAGLALTAALTVSGVWLVFVDELNHVEMSLLLFHILGGFLFAVPCVMLTRRHVRYAAVFARAAFSWLGWGTILAFVVTFGTGIWLTFRGVTGVYWLWLIHVVVSLVAAVGIVAYVAWILRAFQDALPATAKAKRFLRSTLSRLGVRIGALATAILAACGLGAWVYREPPKDLEVEGYVYVRPGEPFYPSRAATASGGFYDPEQFLGSKSCGVSGCHTATTRQWEESVHYRTPSPVFAAVQSLFMEEARKGEFLMDRPLLQLEPERTVVGGEESFRFCAGCHTPVALLAGEIRVGQGLPSFEEREAVSCILCHRITSVGDSGKAGGGDYEVTPPPNRYLFEFSDHPVGRWLSKTLINAKPEHHKRMFMKPFYHDSEYCSGCHTRLQFSYWEQSVFADETHADHKECQDCHFEDVEVTDDVSAYVDGKVADHRSLAANLVTPILYGLKDQYRATVEFMRDENQLVRLVTPSAAAPGAPMALFVRVINKGAGHIFPAGPESDLIEAWTELIVRDATGRALFEYGLLDARGYIDHETTYVYNVRPFDRHGKMLELDRHRNWVFTEDRLHVLPARHYDEHPFTVQVPADAEGPLHVTTRLRFRKFNQQFLDFAAQAGFMERIEAPVVELDEAEAQVELSRDPAALAASTAGLEEELENPTDLDDYTKKPRFDDYMVAKKVSLSDQLLINRAQEMFVNEQYAEALALVRQVGEVHQDLMVIRRLVLQLEKAVAENSRTGAQEVRPFDAPGAAPL